MTATETVTSSPADTLPSTGGSPTDTLPSTGGGGGPLPHTGADGMSLLLSLGLGLLSIGLLVYGSARRVRTH
ncbi:MAG: LPXTG cell wall anchor domain-containing protein [Actinomycetes bacterium]